MRIAVKESKPRANMREMKMVYKGIISSLIPKVEPPRLKMSIEIGITRIPFSFNPLASASSARSIAPVLSIIPKAPPTISTKDTTSTALITPCIGALRICGIPCFKSPASLLLGTI
ncbi:hypothetical protein D3C85_1417810 [compost metagenome]